MVFRVGERVVCINAQHTLYPCPRTGATWEGGLDGLKEKTVYTIRGLDYDPELSIPVVRLVEIIRPMDLYLKTEAAYDAARFRPLVTCSQAQDTEAFLSIANNVDPLLRAMEYEDAENRLEALWAAMGRFGL